MDFLMSFSKELILIPATW